MVGKGWESFEVYHTFIKVPAIGWEDAHCAVFRDRSSRWGAELNYVMGSGFSVDAGGFHVTAW